MFFAIDFRVLKLSMKRIATLRIYKLSAFVGGLTVDIHKIIYKPAYSNMEIFGSINVVSLIKDQLGVYDISQYF